MVWLVAFERKRTMLRQKGYKGQIMKALNKSLAWTTTAWSH